MRLEGAADHPDAAVHHIRGSEDVASGFGLDERHLLEGEERLVVLDDAAAHQAIVAVGVVGVQSHVEQDSDLGDGCPDGARGAADQVFRVPGFGGLRVFVGVLGVWEERQTADAEGRGLLGGAHGTVEREAGDTGERGDRLLQILTLSDEDRPDEVGGAKAGLRDHLADPGRPP